jgi:hypothetical protein
VYLFCWFLDSRAEICQIFGMVFWKILEAKNSLWNYLTFKAKVFFAKSEIKNEQIKDELSGSQPEFEVILTAWLWSWNINLWFTKLWWLLLNIDQVCLEYWYFLKWRNKRILLCQKQSWTTSFCENGPDFYQFDTTLPFQKKWKSPFNLLTFMQ